ncbi:hypothetical protein PPL_00501 [Heterostelium album PN500]|uniref:Uncharacterized protein n=1 Tax=Heterostelium pallidum (strain ATCC 26659 / Pp 5 / PN500) TaxID=670386 RepID=D3AWM6_HETP5|nr:hypothetical protein PPL_00501 [Heterostelium album PN500]EFA86699.1 hypothetical protein PPL_00501 [Heterostelium album PN500]|eukprot:XP_020438803.1 hypothetical protein PPL_00501 [Heterostelium album PN500]
MVKEAFAEKVPKATLTFVWKNTQTSCDCIYEYVNGGLVELKNFTCNPIFRNNNNKTERGFIQISRFGDKSINNKYTGLFFTKISIKDIPQSPGEDII